MLNLEQPLAIGRTAEIYAWDEGQVVKLFKDWMSTGAVEHEARVSRMVHGIGLSVPDVGEIVNVEGRLGLVYERVEGPSMIEMFKSKPWELPRLARRLAELHTEMHSRRARDLPAQRERLQDRIQSVEGMTAEVKDTILEALHDLPTGDRLCHGDFHPGNVMMTADGPIIIDWIDATGGNPMADVARTSLLLRIGALPPDSSIVTRRLLGVARRWFHAAYLQHYFEVRPIGLDQLNAWHLVVAAGRLYEDIAEEQERLIAMVKAGLPQEE